VERTGPDPRAALQGSVLRELLIIDQLGSTRINRTLRTLGLSLTQVSVMSHLADHPEGTSVGALARAMEINQPGISKIVNTLSDHGAVETSTVPDDARVRIVRLTPPGLRLLVRAQQHMHPELTSTFADLDDTRLTQLHELLIIVRERLDAARSSDPG
jgi:DNA-binding MarR family transcriptional regulator